MEDHECPRCGYEASSIYLFKKHILRKNICDPLKSDISLDELKESLTPKELNYECNLCDRNFSSLHGLSIHKKKCTGQTHTTLSQDNEIKNLRDEVNVLKEQIKNYSEIEEKVKHFSEIEEQVKHLTEIVESNQLIPYEQKTMNTQKTINIQKTMNTQNNEINAQNNIQNNDINTLNNIQNNEITTQNNIQNNIQNININNITINPLGSENMSYITLEFMLDCITKKVKADGLAQFLISKHFNPEHPENHNIICCGDNYDILEIPELSNSKNIIERRLHDDNKNNWIKLKKFQALQHNIICRAELAFRLFFKDFPIDKIPEKMLDDFIRDLVLPMDWSMELEKEDEIEEPKDPLETKRRIYKRIKDLLDEAYYTLVSKDQIAARC